MTSLKVPLPFLERIHSIATVSREILRPSRERKRLISQLESEKQYSGPMIATCLEQIFSNVTVERLTEWWIQEARLTKTARFQIQNEFVRLIPPSTVYAATWQAAMAIWLAGYSLEIVPSRRSPGFAHLLMKWVNRIAGNRLPIRVMNRITPAPGRVIAYGSDQTLELIRSSSRQEVLGFGSRFSLGLARSVNPSRGLMKKIAGDIIWYEGQGCLSPKCLFLVVNRKSEAREWGKKLWHELRKLEKNYPRVHSKEEPLEAERLWMKWKFRVSRGKANIAFPYFAISPDVDWEPVSLRRWIQIIPVSRPGAVMRYLGLWSHRISTVAWDEGEWSPAWKRIFQSVSGIRHCAWGEMHRPSLDWRNGGVSILNRLWKET